MNVSVGNKEEYDLEAYYGLPQEVKFCKKCIISNQRPNSDVETKHTIKSQKKTIHFNEDGICDACLVAEAKRNIDWNEKERELIDLCNKYRSKDGSYDCLVPGSGGKDSFYQAHMLKYKYGMHPLTITWAPHIYTDWGWRNMQKWIHAGFDNLLMTPNGRVHRLLTRLATETIFHPFQPFVFGQHSLAPKLAEKYNIKLIFYGEHGAEYGNPIADTREATRNFKYFTLNDEKDIYFAGTSVAELKEKYGLTAHDLLPYMPMDTKICEDKDIQIHHLGYYLKWHPQGAYYYAVENGDFQAAPERTSGTYSKYNSIDDKMDDFYYYTTFIKFGIGRATYDAAQEIRNEEIDRDEAVALVKKFDGEYPLRFEKEIFEYLSINEKEFPVANKAFKTPIMTREYFNDLEDKFRSPHLWKKDAGVWKLRHTVWK